ncbi:MAG: glycosyltransferase, partial [Planctomycetales bacterium]|nr:glycosyltransferase [Planctomycetales bacterium]
APDLSVIVCTYNRSSPLLAALESLAAQVTGARFSYEIVIVDNGSTDNTTEVIGTVARGAAQSIVTAIEPVRGIVAARNRGLAVARGRWIAFFDDDQVASPEWLAQLLGAAESRGVLCVGGSVRLCFPNGGNLDDAPTCRMLLSESVSQPARFYDRRFAPSTGNMLVHTNVFARIGHFRALAAERGEDTDLYHRMRAMGIDAWYEPSAVIYHVIRRERLRPAYFLDLAENIGRGLARLEIGHYGRWRFLFVWWLRFGQTFFVRLPRSWWLKWTGSETQIWDGASRARIGTSFLREGLTQILCGNRVEPNGVAIDRGAREMARKRMVPPT